MSQVNVYTEWSPLKEVIVGNSLNFNIKNFDNIFKLLYRDNIGRLSKLDNSFKINKRYVIERQYDLDNFANQLQKLGIRVRRPRQIERPVAFKTPYFKAVMNAVDSPRDMFLCLGDEVIETSPVNRNRYFEGLLLQDIFSEYFRNGSRWTLAPRTKLAQSSIDSVHWSKVNKIHNLDEIENRYEISFDAANCLKFGKDIVMNVGNKNHELGAFWLQRHLGYRFNVHRVRVCDWHIDGMLLPLKPGVLLINPKLKKRLHFLPRKLLKWKMIEAPDMASEAKFSYPRSHLRLASYTGMGINVLSIDENTVQKLLDKQGFNIVPIQLRHCQIFGGGLHCVTLDVNREESYASYLD
jgi:glycine amidinotransferase